MMEEHVNDSPRRAWISTLAAVALSACAPEGAGELVGESQLALATVGYELVHAPHDDVEHLASAWIPGGGNGSIVNAWTSGGRAAYSFMPGPGWYQASTPPGAAFSAYSDDFTYGWPTPENFCEIYDCSATPTAAAFVGYPSAHAVVSPGWRGASGSTAAIVAVAEAEECTISGPCFDVAIVTSADGGNTFTKSRILSTVDGSGGGNIRPDSVYATALLRPERGAMEQYSYTAPIYVVWKGSGDVGVDEYEWWITKVLVAPETGDIVVLNGPKQLEISSDAATVTLQVSEGRDGHETMAMVYSTRYDAGTGLPTHSLPSCPTDATMEIEWRYTQMRGFWHEEGPSYTVAPGIIKADEDWRPCVGASHSSSGGAPPFYANNDRAAFAIHRTSANYGWGSEPAIEHIAFAMTEPTSNKSRIHQVFAYFEIDDGVATWTTSAGFLPVDDPDEEEYLPQIVINQDADYGFVPNESKAAHSAVIRKRVLPDKFTVEIIGRAYPFVWTEWGTKKAWLAPTVVDDDPIVSPWIPEQPEGRSLGLTVFQHCFYDFYGACDPSVISGTGGPVYFYATWARTLRDAPLAPGIFGHTFEP